MPQPPDSDYRRLAALFGHKVEATREARGLTQDELVERSQLSRTQVQNILYSRHDIAGSKQPSNPKLKTIHSLARALRVEITYLVDEDRPVVPVPPPTPDPQPAATDAPARGAARDHRAATYQSVD